MNSNENTTTTRFSILAPIFTFIIIGWCFGASMSVVEGIAGAINSTAFFTGLGIGAVLFVPALFIVNRILVKANL